MSYRKRTLLLILIATVVRCVVACSVELGNDEVYYRMYAQYLQWNYFDHPPVVGWLIRFSTANLYLDHEFFIRLGAIASSAVATWLFYRCGKKLGDAFTGFTAAAAYTATVYGSIIAGTFILPDSPQMVCWVAGLYLLISISKYSHINRVKKKRLLLFAVVAGIGMLCKIHTAFLWVGFLLYIIFYNRQWLKEPVLYLAALITLLFFSPVIYWNIQHHFVTYFYHSERINVAEGGIRLSSFFSFTAGQVFYFNPVIFYLLAVSTIAALKNELPVLSSQKRLLLFSSLPLIAVAAAISLFRDVLPHWTGPAYSGLILLLACYLSRQKRGSGFNKKRLPRSVVAANLLLLALVTAGIICINFFPGTLGKKDRQALGEADPTLDMYGWNELKTGFSKILSQDLRSGIMKKDAVIISNKWFPASHIDHYVALPLKKELIAIGDTNDIHQYAWINNERRSLQQDDDAYCIVPSNNNIDVRERYGKLFTIILPPEIIEQKRNGRSCRIFFVWRLKGYIKRQAPPAAGPAYYPNLTKKRTAA